MIRPLRDVIVAVPIDQIEKVGDIFLPPNKKQGLLQHRRMLVLYSGPKAQEHCPSGTVIYAKETWADEIKHKGRSMWIGRLRDIVGILPDVQIADSNKYDS